MEGATSRLLVTRPTPNDEHFMDKIKYKCSACSAILDFGEATAHPAGCNLQFADRAPAIVRRRLEEEDEVDEPVVRHEIVSNPASRAESDRPLLIICRYNGNRLLARQYRTSMSFAKVREKFAAVANIDPKDLAIYRFCHQRVEDHHTVRDVATKHGVVTLSLFDKSYLDMSELMVNLWFRNVSEPPISQQPVNLNEPESQDPRPRSSNNNSGNNSGSNNNNSQARRRRRRRRQWEEVNNVYLDPFESDEEGPDGPFMDPENPDEPLYLG